MDQGVITACKRYKTKILEEVTKVIKQTEDALEDNRGTRTLANIRISNIKSAIFIGPVLRRV